MQINYLKYYIVPFLIDITIANNKKIVSKTYTLKLVEIEWIYIIEIKSLVEIEMNIYYWTLCQTRCSISTIISNISYLQFKIF